MAKKPTGGLIKGEKKEKIGGEVSCKMCGTTTSHGREYWQNTLLEDLPGEKRRKLRVKMAKKPTGGLIKGEKKKKRRGGRFCANCVVRQHHMRGNIGKINYWRSYQGGKEKKIGGREVSCKMCGTTTSHEREYWQNTLLEGLTRGEKKKVKSKNGKKPTGGLKKGEKRNKRVKMTNKHTRGAKNQKSLLTGSGVECLPPIT